MIRWMLGKSGAAVRVRDADEEDDEDDDVMEEGRLGPTAYVPRLVVASG